jgi:hypothetical protein
MLLNATFARFTRFALNQCKPGIYVSDLQLTTRLLWK